MSVFVFWISLAKQISFYEMGLIFNKVVEHRDALLEYFVQGGTVQSGKKVLAGIRILNCIVNNLVCPIDADGINSILWFLSFKICMRWSVEDVDWW